MLHQAAFTKHTFQGSMLLMEFIFPLSLGWKKMKCYFSLIENCLHGCK